MGQFLGRRLCKKKKVFNSNLKRQTLEVFFKWKLSSHRTFQKSQVGMDARYDYYNHEWYRNFLLNSPREQDWKPIKNDTFICNPIIFLLSTISNPIKNSFHKNFQPILQTISHQNKIHTFMSNKVLHPLSYLLYFIAFL